VDASRAQAEKEAAQEAIEGNQEANQADVLYRDKRGEILRLPVFVTIEMPEQIERD